jgi:hypothetical protein
MSGPASLLTGWSRPSLLRSNDRLHLAVPLLSTGRSDSVPPPLRCSASCLAGQRRLKSTGCLWCAGCCPTQSLPVLPLSVYERRAQAARPVPSPPALRHQGSPPAAIIKGQREPWPGPAFRMDWSDTEGGAANGSWIITWTRIHVHSLPLGACY